MKSIKPGRGPSAMNAIGSIVGIIFAIFWIIMASSMGAPIFFPIFGGLIIIMLIAQTVYHFKNTTSKNRFSEYDITDSSEESDPIAAKLFHNDDTSNEVSYSTDDIKFCPYCGMSLDNGFEFCPKCGKKLP